jgi:hypothetical protein
LLFHGCDALAAGRFHCRYGSPKLFAERIAERGTGDFAEEIAIAGW